MTEEFRLINALNSLPVLKTTVYFGLNYKLVDGKTISDDLKSRMPKIKKSEKIVDTLGATEHDIIGIYRDYEHTKYWYYRVVTD